MESQISQLSGMVAQLQEQVSVAQQHQKVLQDELLSSRQQQAHTLQQLNEHHQLLETVNARGQSHPFPKLPKPVTFTGHRKDPTPQNWTHCMENYLIANRVDLNTSASVQVAAGYLGDSALTWYRLYLAEVDRGVMVALTSWNAFKDALLRHFVPIAPEKVARTRLYTLKQTQSVQSYANEYNMCMLDIPDMTEKDRVDRFLRGLKPDIRVLVELQKPAMLVDAIELATQIDSIMWQSRKPPFTTKGTSSSFISPRTSGPSPMELGNAELNSMNGKKRHLIVPKQRFQKPFSPVRVPPVKAGLPAGGRRPIQCYYCKQMGHVQRFCLRRLRDQQSSGPRGSPES